MIFNNKETKINKSNLKQFPTNQMILMLLKKKNKSKKENSSRTLVKHKKMNPANDIKEINELIRRVSKARSKDFQNLVREDITLFNDKFDTRTEKDFIERYTILLWLI